MAEESEITEQGSREVETPSKRLGKHNAENIVSRNMKIRAQLKFLTERDID